MRAALTEMKRAIFNRNFLVAVVLVFGMYYLDGSQALDQYASVLSLLDMIAGIGAYTWLVPCVGTICFSNSFVEEFEYGYVRYKVVRYGVGKYTCSKCAAVFFSAMLSTCMAIAFYGIYAYSVCGRILLEEELGNYIPYADANGFDALVAQGKYGLYMFLKILFRGMAAGTWALLGLLLSTVWRNKYIAIFSPTIIVYFKDFVYGWLHIYPKVYLKSMEIGSLHVGELRKSLLIIPPTFVALAAAFSVLTYISIRRRLSDV